MPELSVLARVVLQSPRQPVSLLLVLCIPLPLNALVSELQVNAVWHNMREEPVIYINGRPFVLREDERPFKNMQEYTGIDVQRLEQMELRLKNDILQVACSFKLIGR